MANTQRRLGATRPRPSRSFKYVAPETLYRPGKSTANSAAFSETSHYNWLSPAQPPALPFCFFLFSRKKQGQRHRCHCLQNEGGGTRDGPWVPTLRVQTLPPRGQGTKAGGEGGHLSHHLRLAARALQMGSSFQGARRRLGEGRGLDSRPQDRETAK